MNSARIIQGLGRVPILGSALRSLARRYREGSVVTIKHGEAAGFRWKRHHRYLNGYWIGQYELEIQAALKRELRAGDTFFDVGANAGFFTLLASRFVGTEGKCVAFDPLAMNQESIREQIELNGLSHCHGVEVAISDAPGEDAFSFLSIDSARGQLGTTAPLADSTITVKVITLDEASERWGPPDFIKLDVEGAEGKALAGAKHLITEVRPGWLIEIHNDECEVAVREILTAAGYQFLQVDGALIRQGSKLPHHVIARHPAR